MIEQLSPYDIRTDGGTQLRAFPNETVIEEYKEAMIRGDKFTPVVVFRDEEGNDWCADGFHRIRAAKDGQIPLLDADVREGTLRDAILFAAGANAQHGLKRNNADKRRAVETLLNDEEWSQWSNVLIAEKCGVSIEMVRQMREPEVATVATSTRTGRNGVKQAAKKARREREAPPSPTSQSGAALNSLQSKSNDELTTQGLLLNENEDNGNSQRDRQAQEHSSGCQTLQDDESSENEPSNLQNSSASLKSPCEVCQYLVEHEDNLRVNVGHLVWLIEEARRVLDT